MSVILNESRCGEGQRLSATTVGGQMRGTWLAACAILALGIGASAGLDAQSAPPNPADSAARLSGMWKLNKELSPSKPAEALPGRDSGGGGSGGGGTFGGSGGRSRVNGGFGGRGGRSSGGGRSGSESQMLQTRAIMRETTDAPAQLVIVATASDVTLTDDEGHVRKFTANDKKQKVDIGTAEVDAKAKWDAGVFTTELSGGSLKVTTTYQVTVEGHQMVVTSQMQGGRDGQNQPSVTRTYDKSQ